MDSIVSCYDESLLVGESDYQMTEYNTKLLLEPEDDEENSSDESSLGDLEEIRRSNHQYKNKLLKRDSKSPRTFKY